MTRENPVPGLTRDLSQTHETPDQVRGGVAANLDTTLTRNTYLLKNNTFSFLSTVDTP